MTTASSAARVADVVGEGGALGAVGVARHEVEPADVEEAADRARLRAAVARDDEARWLAGRGAAARGAGY